MFDPIRELTRFLDEHGVHGWVTGKMGQRMLLDDWIDWRYASHGRSSSPS